MKPSRRRKDEVEAADSSFETRPDLNWSLPAFDPSTKALAIGAGGRSSDRDSDRRIDGLDDRLRVALSSQERLAGRSEELATQLLEQRQDAIEAHHGLSRRIDALTAQVTELQLRPETAPLAGRVDELAARVDRLGTPHEHRPLTERVDYLARRIDQLSAPHAHPETTDRIEGLTRSVDQLAAELASRRELEARVQVLTGRLDDLTARFEELGAHEIGQTQPHQANRPDDGQLPCEGAHDPETLRRRQAD